ncbi:MAG TPA: hypothetical protein VFS00_13400 [Polyangiaceae bacterium]|nr:hypothetical protein [Polyangiaceae bacterium]
MALLSARKPAQPSGRAASFALFASLVAASLGSLTAGCMGPRASTGTAPARHAAGAKAAVVAAPAAPVLLAEGGDDAPAADDAGGDIFDGLPKGDEQLAALCARGHRDPISLRLCAEPRPPIGSLVELQAALGLAFQPGAMINGGGGNPSFVLLGHSTSLGARHVSAINPRVILHTNPASIAQVPPGTEKRDPKFIAMAFQCGEQLAELVAREPTTGELRFFLVRFEQACNAAGCSPFERFGPAIEQNWTGVTVYEDVDVVNTPADCLVCHQPGGPGTPKMLRMHERRTPWTHFFRLDRPGGEQMIADYRLAHDRRETYGGVPGRMVTASEPARLEGLVENEGFRDQPNEFPAFTIDQETTRYGVQPERSRAWAKTFAKSLAGSALPIPYPDARASDPARLREAAATYRSVLAGEQPPEELPDFAGLLRDSALPMVSLRPRPGLDGEGILRQLCQRCHNPALDQTLSRAAFDVTRLDSMPRDEKEEAKRRLRLPASSPRHMPPVRFGELSPDEIEAAVEALDR